MDTKCAKAIVASLIVSIAVGVALLVANRLRRRSKIVKRVRKGGKPMYTAHPSQNEIALAIPKNLFAAAQNVHEIRFGTLVELRNVVRDLTHLVHLESPDLVPFFATGGIPYMVPIMRRLSEQMRRYDLTDGVHFHLFSGLAWGGEAGSQKSVDLFTTEFGRLLREIAVTHPRAKIIAIDTTNTGGAINKLIDAMSRAVAVSELKPSQIDFRLVGIVNGAHDECNIRKAGKVEVVLGDGTGRFLTPPGGFEVPARFGDRQWLDLSARHPNESLRNVHLSYWVVRELPTEDKAKLLGYLASHETLGMRADSDAGRLAVTYANGRVTEMTGGNTPGHHLISVLVNDENSMFWTTAQATEQLPPVEHDDPEFRQISDSAHEAFRRLFELDTVDDEALAAYLSRNPQLIDGAAIYRLSKMDKAMPHLLRNVKALLAKHPDEAESALAFFRKLRPDIAKQEPADGATAEWWVERLNPK